MTTTEVWRNYKDTEYRVSDRGRVIGKRGNILKPYVHEKTQRSVVSITTLQAEWGNYKVTVADMVLTAFGPPMPNDGGKYHAKFEDGDPSNCNIGNLSWTPIDLMVGIRAGAKAKREKADCKRGHALSGRNLVIRKDGRACAACMNAHAKKSYDRTHHGLVWDEAKFRQVSDDWYRRNITASTVEEL